MRVRAAGVNPTDWKHRATGGLLGEPPFVLGRDLSGDTSVDSLRVLRPGGIVVSILPVGSGELHDEAERLGVRAARILVDADRAGTREIARLVEAGQLRATIAGTFPLADAAGAHRLGDTGRTAGKLVLTVD